MKLILKGFLFLSILILQACSNLPANIKNAPNGNIQLHQAVLNSSSYQSSPIRWGGTIIDVENKTDEVNLQILSYPLNYYGRPLVSQPAMGRFMTVSTQFLDPAIYTKGLEITIAGRLQGNIEKHIGEKSITLPIVTIDSLHIWPAYQSTYYNDYNYYNNYRYLHYNSGYRRGYFPHRSFRSRYRYYRCD